MLTLRRAQEPDEAQWARLGGTVEMCPLRPIGGVLHSTGMYQGMPGVVPDKAYYTRS
jgi:hypothetical protein